MFLSLRGTVSAAVRLGIVGPHAAQAMQHRLSRRAEEQGRVALEVPVEDVAQTSPVADLFQACHDRLYSRLFQS